jgi:hypothetical protein
MYGVINNWINFKVSSNSLALILNAIFRSKVSHVLLHMFYFLWYGTKFLINPHDTWQFHTTISNCYLPGWPSKCCLLTISLPLLKKKKLYPYFLPLEDKLVQIFMFYYFGSRYLKSIQMMASLGKLDTYINA